ncbi:MAG: hypothetical protein JWR69_1190 [Pedosphaera sp.]|nr:hypothetical protein [Pedosphaera sp.]
MRLTRFKIQKYKSVIDSGWVNVANLTVLVGKNEAGKTSLLKALHKFNPFKPEPYSLSREWPRGLRGERSEAQVVCTAEFRLEPGEKKKLEELAAQPWPLDDIQVTKNYAGRFEVLFPEAVFPANLHSNELASSAKDLPQPADQLSGEFRGAANECRAEATLTGRQKAHDFVVRSLPTFVYMDEYQTFSGTAQIDVIKRRQERNDLQPQDETFLTILALAELDLLKEYGQGGKSEAAAREELQFDLSDGEATLNRKIEDHWGQLRYQVQFRADSSQFMTFVRGGADKALIRLEERSKGFQWFFSFDLMLMHETRGRLKGCVILLDEPGLHLHPEGQSDLMARLSEYAGANTLIYTTHLPFLIDLQEPERIRVISETEAGTQVFEDLTSSQPAAKLVLQAALGISGRSSWLVAEQNIVVAGADDYWILTEISHLFHRAGRAGLPPDVLVTPAGGASEVTYLATFMVGQELEVVALFDSDSAGRAAREKLVKSWLPKFHAPKAAALDLGESAGKPGQDFTIEDLFPETFYATQVLKTYDKQLSAAGLSLSPLPPGNQLVKRVEAVFQSANLPFNKRMVCKRLAASIRQMKGVADLPEQTRQMAEKLFAAIANGFIRK